MKNKSFLFKNFIISIVFIMTFFIFMESVYAARCQTATTTLGPCYTIDSAGSACSMNVDAGCWPDQSTLTSLSVCVVNQTIYTDTEYTYGSDTVCNSFKECEENGCPADNAKLYNGDLCYVSEYEKDVWAPHDWSDVSKTAGVWSKNESACVKCGGVGNMQETSVCGTPTNTYYNGAVCTGPTVDNLCEEACGADQRCDEKAIGWTDGVTGTCEDGGGGNGCIWTPIACTCAADGCCDDTCGVAGDPDCTCVALSGNLCTSAVITCTGTDNVPSSDNIAPAHCCLGTCAEYWECGGGDAIHCDAAGNPFGGLTSCASLNGTMCGPGKVYAGCGTCDPSADADCSSFTSLFKSIADVCDCNCVTIGPPPCIPIWSCTAWSVCAGSTRTRTCTDIKPCGLPPVPESQDCCTVDADCVSAPLLRCKFAEEKCVECREDSHCGVNERCFLDECVPCKGEGEEVNDPGVCCAGLSWWDVDFDGQEECTSACDPSASFFCNTLRDSVDTLVEGGEKMIGYILGLIGSVALLLVIIAGIMYMTSAGNEEKIASSKKILTGSVIGLGIALLAFSLLQVVLSVLNM